MSAASGLAVAFATPPFDVVPLVEVGLAGLAFALSIDLPAAAPRATAGADRGQRRVVVRREWLTGGARGLAFGAFVNVVGLRFVPAVIARFTPLPFVAGVVALLLLSVAQGLPWALAGMVRAALVRGRIPRPIAFALGVYAASFVPCVFPWTPAGLVAGWPVLVQLADTIGERGVSFLLALAAGCLAEGVRLWPDKKERRLSAILAGVGLLLPCAMAAQGSVRMDTIDDRRLHSKTTVIGLIQPSIPATTRWDPAEAPSILDRLTRLSDVAELKGSALTIWPESAYPYVLAHGAAREPVGEQRIHRRGIQRAVVVGAVTQDASGDRLNSAIGLEPDGVMTPSYDKLHLLWFGESVPFAGVFPWLRRTFARGLGMVPGKGPVRIDLANEVKAGIMICYEDTLPESGREAALLDPNVLVNMTNDAWFEGSAESEIHLRLSRLRAVEARRDLVRAVNLGPTSMVDAAGRVKTRYDLRAPGSLLATVALLETSSIYTALGDWPWLLGCAIAVYALWKRGEKSDGAEPADKKSKKKPASS